MTALAIIVDLACRFYLLVLLARAILDLVRVASPMWQPSGIILVLANWVYALTDPPLNFLRRFIPPLRLGAVALDVGFLVLFFGVSLLDRYLVSLLFRLGA